jgi:LacI family transcriptional regulator
MMAKKRSTMLEVARLAGVSVGTVSAIVNDSHSVRPHLRERVEEAMRVLDYHPNHIARSLKTNRSYTVGMIIPDVTNPFFTDVMRGVEDTARAGGYSVILCNSNEDPAQERTHVSTLFARRVDGILLAPTDGHAAEDRLTHRRFPIVFFDRIPTGFRGQAVVAENFEAAYAATRHLIELKHQRIAIITGKLDLRNGIDRLEGYRKAMQEAHLPIYDEYLQRGNFQLESGYECGLRLLRLAHPPTAIFCCNNKMTLGLMRALAELQVPCPQKVSVLGFDDFDWASSFRPKLTTVAQPTYEIGKKAMELLMRNIEASEESVEEVLIALPAELRIRESTAPPSS